MGKYLETTQGKFYVRGSDLTPVESRSYTRTTQGTRIHRAVKSVDRRIDSSLFMLVALSGPALWAIMSCVVIVLAVAGVSEDILISLAIASVLLMLSASIGGSVLLGIGKVVCAGIERHLVRPSSHWVKQLEASPNAIKLSGDGVRPAVEALGTPGWFKKNAHHGDAIDAYLDNPYVQEIEADLLALGDEVDPEVDRKARDVLSQLANGYVYEAVREIEQAERDKEEAEAAVRRERKIALNQAVDTRLNELSKAIVMPHYETRELR